VIDLIITAVTHEPGHALRVTVAPRHFLLTVTLTWSAPVDPGFVATVAEAHRRRTVLLVADGFFERDDAHQRAVVVRALARLFRLQNKPVPWDQTPR
jgi:hypothetical protein